VLGGRRYLSGCEFPWAPIIDANDITRVKAHRPVADLPVQVDTITFEGCLLPMEVIRTVGLPYRNFYIDGDDWDYGLRIRKAGYSILRVPATVIVRKIEPKQHLARIPLLGLRSLRSGISPERTYYEVRNKFKLIDRHAIHRTVAILRETVRALRRVFGVLAFDDRKLLRSLLIIEAVAHGWGAVEGRNDRLRL
jgi:GT2 family glycosyltransferase